MKNYKAAVDIGGTKVTASLADMEGFKIRIYQPVKLEGDNRAIPNQVDFLIEYGCDKAGIKKGHIDALGISTCSPFKKRGNYRVIVAENLCGGINKKRELPNNWTEIPLEEELSKIYRELIIENDCTSAVVAEKLFGAAKGKDNVIYITWSTGIGGGAYVTGIDQSGKKTSLLLTGKEGNALEVGHITIADGPLCECGGYGHLQTMVSGEAIAMKYGAKKTEEVFEAYRKGDKRAKKVIHETAEDFAKGLATLNTYDNEMFVIGGSVFMNNSELLLPLIEKGFRKYSHPILSEKVRIEPSALGEYLGDMAALCLVMPREWVGIWEEKEPWRCNIETITPD